MKALLKIFAVMAVFSFALTSCGDSDDVCKKVECGDYGSCDGVLGVCDCNEGYATNASDEDKCTMCADGYEGYPNCVVARGKFLGTFNVVDDCIPTDPYSMEVTAGADGVTSIRLKNLGNYVCSSGGSNVDYFVDATVTGDSVTIVNGTYCSTLEFSGTGKLTQSAGQTELVLDYTAVTPSGTDNCTITATK